MGKLQKGWKAERQTVTELHNSDHRGWHRTDYESDQCRRDARPARLTASYGSREGGRVGPSSCFGAVRSLLDMLGPLSDVSPSDTSTSAPALPTGSADYGGNPVCMEKPVLIGSCISAIMVVENQFPVPLEAGSSYSVSDSHTCSQRRFSGIVFSYSPKIVLSVSLFS